MRIPTFRGRWILPILALLAACASVPEPRRYENPVLARDFPDPAVLRVEGTWYAYATQNGAGEAAIHIQVARSRDLVHWEYLGAAMPAKPDWARRKANQRLWAPHVVHDAALGRYVMYYSAEPDQGTGKCLAVATAARPEGPFVDAGRPLLCGTAAEHIDPMAFDDPASGRKLLYWGSAGMPLLVRELAPDRLGFLPGSVAREVLLPDPNREYSALIEGAWVVYRQGRYYLFYSGDRCCSREPRYAVMVARAADPWGPFTPLERADRPSSSAILERGGRWVAPGHNSIATDDEGVDWLLYHATEVAAPQRGRVMLLDRIVWRDGWPRTSDGVPSWTDSAPTVRYGIADPGEAR